MRIMSKMTKCTRGHAKMHMQSFLVEKKSGHGLKTVKACDYIIGYRLVDGKGSMQALMCKDLADSQPIPKGYRSV